MPTIASGVAKKVAIRKETTWGDEGSAITTRTGGQYLRRVTSDLSLKKETYQSEEIRTDYQIADMRHGVRSVGGTISGELSTTSWKLFLAAAMRKAWAVGGTASGIATLTVADGAAPLKTLTRGAGSFVSDGFKVGDVCTITAGTGSTDQLNKNVLCVSLTATVMTVLVLNGLTMTNAALTTATISTKGWKTFTPTSGHTDDSFLIEHYFGDIAQSELFSGCKINSLDIDLPPTGIAKINFGIMGRDMLDTTARRGSVAATTEYFSSATAAPTTGVMAAVNGAVTVGGTQIALLTGLKINYQGGMSGDPVVGANVYPDIAEGRVQVSGEMTVLFSDATMRDYFVNETAVEICSAFTENNTADSPVFAITIPRAKLAGADKSDGEKGLIMTMPFTAILGTGTGAGAVAGNAVASTLVFQDSTITS